MTSTTILILLLIGLAAGFISGLIGIGGGIIIVPALVFFLGFTQKMAQGTSLGLILFPVGILAVMQYYKQGNLNFTYVAVLAIAFVIGGFLGGKLASSINDQLMKKVFGVVLLLVGLKMLFLDKPKNQDARSAKTQQTESSVMKP